jgi:ribosome-associated protein
MPGDETDDSDEEQLRSRSDLRRETQQLESELMELAKWLVNQNARVLDRLSLDAGTLAAIRDARQIDAPGARKRAHRLVRTALRGTDLTVLRRRIEAYKYGEAKTDAEVEAETWTARLLAGGEDEVSAFVAAHPSADRQQVRQLVRNAKKAVETKAAEARRALSKGLLASVQAPPVEDATDTDD